MKILTNPARRAAAVTLAAAALTTAAAVPSLAGPVPGALPDDSGLAAAATPTPAPDTDKPDFVGDGKAHTVTNSSQQGSLIHVSWSANKEDKMPVQSWTGGDVQLGNKWYFEGAKQEDGYTWFRMRNSRSSKCIIPGGEYNTQPAVWTWTCSSGEEFYWRAEPQNENGRNKWRLVKFISKSVSSAMKPWDTKPSTDTHVVLTDDGYSQEYYWSVAR